MLGNRGALAMRVRSKVSISHPTYYDEAGSVKDFLSKPHSQKLYAMNNASPGGSIMCIRRPTNPMTVRNKKAVMATPKSVDDRGDEAAAGYD
jgi:hypothetical protein